MDGDGMAISPLSAVVPGQAPPQSAGAAQSGSLPHRSDQGDRVVSSGLTVLFSFLSRAV
jgi:hypothetical protein